MGKILTIIVPTYNMEKYLDKCLTSLILVNSQLMSKLEVLVVIDGAKDRSSKIAHSYEDKYPETFRVIDKENGNYGSCVNRGLKEATGKYVKILDADDSFDNENFSILMDKIADLDVDLILTDTTFVDPDDREIKKYTFPFVSNNILQYKSIANHITAKGLIMHSVAYKTQNLRAINYVQSEGISYTDMEWIFIPMTTVKTIFYNNTPVYRYLVGREGQTVDPKISLKNMNHHITSDIKMLEEYTAYLKTNVNHYKEYLHAQIYDHFNILYIKYLLLYPCLSNDELRYADNELKRLCAEIYDEFNIKGVVKDYFRYIKSWRKNSQNPTLYVKILSYCSRCAYYIIKKMNISRSQLSI